MESYVRTNFNNGTWRKRRWLTIFPEGGFKYKRLANSRRFAEKNELEQLEHCTYPRHFGIHTATKVGSFETKKKKLKKSFFLTLNLKK